jgi:ubiquinone/menaquinone biosynthesis C-methylase UbiE
MKFQDRIVRSHITLSEFDKKHDNPSHARKFVPRNLRYLFNYSFEDHHRFSNPQRTHYNNARVAHDYLIENSILEDISKSKLAGKKILHLAGSTGVFAHFLKTQKGMDAQVLDINRSARKENNRRGVKAKFASAITKVKARVPVKMKNGVWLRKETVNQLPYKSHSFDFLLSEHFLFSDFHKRLGGFEKQEGSAQESERMLNEYNRILKKGGRLIISNAHALPSAAKIKEGRKISGFVVEKIYDRELQVEIPDGEKTFSPIYFVLKKVKEAQRERVFYGGKGVTPSIRRNKSQ